MVLLKKVKPVKDTLKSGVLGLGTAALANNPEMWAILLNEQHSVL
jgi:hypothetical protein